MRYLIAAGGTSGHVNPAIAVAEVLTARDKNARILFVGTKNKIEASLVPKAGFDMEFIEVIGLSRRKSWSGLKQNISAGIKYRQAKKQIGALINQFRPDIAIGTGGYVSAPVISEAAKRGIKTVILEQNAFAGVTTKLLAKKVDKILLSLQLAKPLNVAPSKVKVVGNPARPEFLTMTRAASRKKLGLRAEDIVVLSCGGSLGATCINDAFCRMAEVNVKEGNLILFHSASREYQQVLDRLGEVAQHPCVQVFEYIYNMSEVMAAADLVISRSGATTLTELSALGRAAILIPSPYVAENHQYFNAKAFADAGAGLLIEEKDLPQTDLFQMVCDIVFDKEKLRKMEQSARTLYNRNCLDDIYNEIQTL